MSETPLMCEPIHDEAHDLIDEPQALVIRTAGTNCDRELLHAFTLAGARAHHVHLQDLRNDPAMIDEFDLIGVPGGFSYGDDIAAGKIFALLLKGEIEAALRRAVQRGVPIFAPCNGFQILVKMGLLPDLPDDSGQQRTTLVQNIGGSFIDRWVRVDVNEKSPCIWTKGIRGGGDGGILPIAHGEGRFVASESTLDALEAHNRIALRYSDGENVNGSMRSIAGICDSTGLVFGLMPHPERFTTWLTHPWRTRLDKPTLASEPMGLAMFRNAVEHASTVRQRRS